jgi:hypothetical protein
VLKRCQSYQQLAMYLIGKILKKWISNMQKLTGTNLRDNALDAIPSIRKKETLAQLLQDDALGIRTMDSLDELIQIYSSLLPTLGKQEKICNDEYLKSYLMKICKFCFPEIYDQLGHNKVLRKLIPEMIDRLHFYKLLKLLRCQESAQKLKFVYNKKSSLLVIRNQRHTTTVREVGTSGGTSGRPSEESELSEMDTEMDMLLRLFEAEFEDISFPDGERIQKVIFDNWGKSSKHYTIFNESKTHMAFSDYIESIFEVWGFHGMHDNSNRQKMYRYFQWIFQKLQIVSGFWYKLKKTGKGSVRWRFDQSHTLQYDIPPLNDSASSVEISGINQIIEQEVIQPLVMRTPNASGHDTNTNLNTNAEQTTKEGAKKKPKRSRTSSFE